MSTASTVRSFTVELNQPADGQYRFTLLDNLDHHAAATADDVENIIGINLNNRVLILDTGDPGDIEPIANFSINVIDDVPVAEPNTRTVPVGTLQTVDVQLIVDISGSMGDDVGDVPDFSDNRMVVSRTFRRTAEGPADERSQSPAPLAGRGPSRLLKNRFGGHR